MLRPKAELNVPTVIINLHNFNNITTISTKKKLYTDRGKTVSRLVVALNSPS